MSSSVSVEPVSSVGLVRRACEMTLRPGMKSSVSLAKLYMSEHSPIRAMMFWVELTGIPTFVSVHLVRHKVGVEHFVQSNRDDRGGGGDGVVNRLTPVNHGMMINAAALLAMSRKRLCFLSHKKTVAVWTRLRRAVRFWDPDLGAVMVPECVVRGYCPEMRQCSVGLGRVLEAYAESPHCQRRGS